VKRERGKTRNKQKEIGEEEMVVVVVVVEKEGDMKICTQ
jgi:hypothetical protein